MRILQSALFVTLFELAQAQTAWNPAVLQSSVATHARCGGIIHSHIHHIYQRMFSEISRSGMRRPDGTDSFINPAPHYYVGIVNKRTHGPKTLFVFRFSCWEHCIWRAVTCLMLRPMLYADCFAYTCNYSFLSRKKNVVQCNLEMQYLLLCY